MSGTSRRLIGPNGATLTLACMGLLTGSSTLLAALPAPALLPDIVDAPPSHLQVVNAHQEEVIRFTTEHINIGVGPLQVRSDSTVGACVVDGTYYDQCTAASQEVLDENGNVVYQQLAGYAVFHPEHNHWHQNGVADFILLEGSLEGVDVNAALQDGTIDALTVASAPKTTYCLIDYDKTELVHRNNERTYFDCNGDLQGISVGWSDEYHHSTHGQELVITGLADGIYSLLYVADPLDHWVELDETNNWSWSTFSLSRKGANAKISEIAHSACEEGITCGSSSNK